WLRQILLPHLVVLQRWVVLLRLINPLLARINQFCRKHPQAKCTLLIYNINRCSSNINNSCNKTRVGCRCLSETQSARAIKTRCTNNKHKDRWVACKAVSDGMPVLVVLDVVIEPFYPIARWFVQLTRIVLFSAFLVTPSLSHYRCLPFCLVL